MKYTFILSLLTLFGSVGLVQAADPSFNFVPASGSELKLHCNYNFNVLVQAGGQKYNSFAAVVKYTSSDVQINHISVNSPFTQNQNGFLTGGNLYRSNGSLPAGQFSNADANAVTFGFKTLTNITSAGLQFTDYLGNPLIFGLGQTSDQTSLDGFDVFGDILTGVNNATYTFVPLPCIPDVTVPTFTNVVPSGGSRYIPSNQVVSFLVYDWAGAGSVSGPTPLGSNNRQHYWYQGLDTSTLSNYISAPVTVDNQEGIHSGTIKATVSCPTCVSFGGPYTLTSPSLTITLWTGDASRNRYTWNSKDRGYWVSFNAPAAYEIEKQVIVQLETVDNPNENGAVHTGTTSFSFNAPQSPVITALSHSNGTTFVNPKSTNLIRFYISDDWAGINTGTVQIEIPEIMSGAELLLTGYTYSGSDLIFTLSGGSVGLGNSGKYLVEFYPKWDFPANDSVTMEVTAVDLASTTGTLSTSFTTRPDCAYFGCSEILNVNILGGVSAGISQFTGKLLVITGTNVNSPYPYLTGVNNDIVMCGIPYAGAVLTGNIDIMNTQGSSIKGTTYTGTALYITGLDFTIVNGVIIVQ